MAPTIPEEKRVTILLITSKARKGQKKTGKKCMCLITALASGPKLHVKEPTIKNP